MAVGLLLLTLFLLKLASPTATATAFLLSPEIVIIVIFISPFEKGSAIYTCFPLDSSRWIWRFGGGGGMLLLLTTHFRRRLISIGSVSHSLWWNVLLYLWLRGFVTATYVLMDETEEGDEIEIERRETRDPRSNSTWKYVVEGRSESRRLSCVTHDSSIIIIITRSPIISSSIAF